MKGLMRTVGVAILILAGAGGLMLAGAGAAGAQPAGATACQQFFAAVRASTAAIKGGAGSSSFQSQIDNQATQMNQAVSSGSPALKAAVKKYGDDLKATAAALGNFNSPQLKADGNAIVAICTAEAKAASGAPATGGGSAAGVQDPALFGVGAAAVLAGAGVLVLARRNRPRHRPGHG